MRQLSAVLFVLVVAAAGCDDSDAPSVTLEPTAQPVATLTTLPASDDEFEAPDPTDMPEVAAPHGLSTVELADSVDGIIALFEALPSEFFGEPLVVETGAGRIMASYGTTETVGCALVGVQAMDVSTGGFYPEGWTAESNIALLSSGADWEVEDFGREGDLYWVRWNTTCGEAGRPGSDVIFSLSWGDAGSPWMFSAGAGHPEDRAELTEALVASAG